MITLKKLREFTQSMSDETQVGISHDEEAGADVLAFHQPGSDGFEIIFDVGYLPAFEEDDDLEEEQAETEQLKDEKRGLYPDKEDIAN